MAKKHLLPSDGWPLQGQAALVSSTKADPGSGCVPTSERGFILSGAGVGGAAAVVGITALQANALGIYSLVPPQAHH